MGLSRKQLISSPDWHLAEIQQLLFEEITHYLDNNNITQTQLAEQLGCTKSYVSQILNGNFDFRLSKFLELLIAVGKVPKIELVLIDSLLDDEQSVDKPIEIKYRYKDTQNFERTINGKRKPAYC